MAYGNLVDYEPTPQPGVYNFLTKDGRKLQAFGQVAEDYKRKLDEAKAMGPQPTASLAPTVNPEQGIRNALAGAGVVTDAPAPNPSAAPPPKPAPVAAPSGPPVPGAPAPGPAVPRAGVPGAVPVAPGHRYNTETGLIEAYGGAVAARPGGLRDTSQTVRGAIPENPEYVAEQRQLSTEEQQAIKARAEGEQSIADAEHSRNFKLALHYDDAQRQAQDRADFVERRVRELDQTWEQANKEFNSARVDPRRMFAGGKNWMYGLFAGLSTFGAGLSKTPNFGLQILEKRIDDDIEAQRAEVAVKRDAADNAYKRLMAETGSDALAKEALKGIQLSKLNAELEVAAKNGKDKIRQANAQAMLVGARQRLADWREDYRRASVGEVTKNMVYVPASAGRPAGWYTVSDQLGTAGKIQNLQQGEVNIQKTSAETGAEAGPPIPAERSKQIGLNAQAIDQAESVMKQLPAGDQSDFGDPAGGLYDTSGFNPAGKKLAEETAALATTVQISSNMGSTEDDRKQAGELVGEGGSIAARKRGARSAAEAAARRIVVEVSTLPPAQQQVVLSSMSPTARAYVERALQKSKGAPQ